MTQARREGEKGRQRERRRDRGEQNDSTLSCCTEYDDGTVLSFRLVGECLSFRTLVLARARVCVCVCVWVPSTHWCLGVPLSTDWHGEHDNTVIEHEILITH